jgi:hypothetical protein
MPARRVQRSPRMRSGAGDATTERLAQLFAEHPAWRAAARRLSRDATSTVYFSQRPGEAWRLERRGQASRLLAGAASDPDLVFRFTPAAVERLAAVSGGVGDFAVALFELLTSPDPEARVDLRVAAGFARLVRRGYLGVLAAGGPQVLAFGASHGIRSLTALRRFVSQRRSSGPQDWEERETAVTRR